MSIFNLTRKSMAVLVGDSEITLTEPSALERIRFGEALSGLDFDNAEAAEIMSCEVRARIGLIADCMRYTLPEISLEEIKKDICDLPPEQLNALSVAAMKLSGQLVESEDGEEEKKQ